MSSNDYAYEASPFYVILILLVFEKLAQCWLLDKFGLDEEITRKYEKMVEIHKSYKKSKNLRKQTLHRLAQLSEVDRTSVIGRPARFGEQLTPIVEEHDSDLRDSVPPDSHPEQMNMLMHSEREAFMAFDREEDRQSRKMTLDPVIDKQSSRVSILQVEESDSPIIELSKQKDELLDKIREKFEIASKIKRLNALKTVLEDVVILLVWVSCIYKENVLSLVLFLVLAYFTFTRSALSVLVVRYTVVIIFVLEYFMALSCLSSYNSPQSFPASLLGTAGVYPNSEYFFFDIPVYFGYKNVIDQQPIDYTVNLNVTTYLGFSADRGRLNGMWIDYSVILMVLFYFNFCNFWMLFQPTQIVRSATTKSDINQYIEYVH